jgi:hypothetical protein
MASPSRARSLGLTVTSTDPASGSAYPAWIWAFAYARPKSESMPITSPVLFISGPSRTSTPGNLRKGKTGCFTATRYGAGVRVNPSSSRLLPAMTSAPILASCTPTAFATYGTVREARGLTSST